MRIWLFNIKIFEFKWKFFVELIFFLFLFFRIRILFRNFCYNYNNFFTCSSLFNFFLRSYSRRLTSLTLCSKLNFVNVFLARMFSFEIDSNQCCIDVWNYSNQSKHTKDESARSKNIQKSNVNFWIVFWVHRILVQLHFEKKRVENWTTSVDSVTSRRLCIC